jgi:ornithine carbamoyltransferase
MLTDGSVWLDVVVGEEQTAEVLDGPQSVIYDQAIIYMI